MTVRSAPPLQLILLAPALCWFALASPLGCDIIDDDDKDSTDDTTTGSDSGDDGSTVSCTPGQSTCINDNAAVQICNRAGDGWDVFQCVHGCVDVGGTEYCTLSQESEGNDTHSTANAVTLPYEGSGQISQVDDLDWYTFTLDAESTLVVDTYPMNHLGDVMDANQVWLVSETTCTGAEQCANPRFFCGTLIDANSRACNISGVQHGGGDDYLHITADTYPAGTYYVVVGSHYDPPTYPGETGFYGLIIKTQ